MTTATPKQEGNERPQATSVHPRKTELQLTWACERQECMLHRHCHQSRRYACAVQGLKLVLLLMRKGLSRLSPMLCQSLSVFRVELATIYHALLMLQRQRWPAP
jgi:hypothetical protein